MSGGAADLRAESPEEQVLWHRIVWTYAYYLLGARYVLAPVVGWTLLLRQAPQCGQGDHGTISQLGVGDHFLL